MVAAKILITEDEVLIARDLEATLQDLGYAVVGIAHDGMSALQKVAETQPDIVLMDIVMPGELDGIDTAEQIRDRFQIPVIYLTAYADSDTLRRAKITEPFGYVLKPFQPQNLNIAIQVALARHRSEQRQLNTLRTNISASLPHEVYTPLNAIIGFSDFLLEQHDLLPSSEMVEILQYIHTSAKRLERVCHNLVLWSHLEILTTDRQKVEGLTQKTTCSLQALIQNKARQKAKEFNRSTDLDLDVLEAVLPISETYLDKIVEELLDNAFKFSDIGKKILVQGQVQDGNYCLMIRDHGRGMSPEQVATLGAYMQFDRNLYEQQGLGLGLALVKRLTELHKGTLSINSTIHEGTTCTIQLPVVTP
jgi:two-component system, sensor histidine kinase and response regulator